MARLGDPRLDVQLARLAANPDTRALLLRLGADHERSPYQRELVLRSCKRPTRSNVTVVASTVPLQEDLLRDALRSSRGVTRTVLRALHLDKGDQYITAEILERLDHDTLFEILELPSTPDWFFHAFVPSLAQAANLAESRAGLSDEHLLTALCSQLPDWTKRNLVIANEDAGRRLARQHSVALPLAAGAVLLWLPGTDPSTIRSFVRTQLAALDANPDQQSISALADHLRVLHALVRRHGALLLGERARLRARIRRLQATDGLEAGLMLASDDEITTQLGWLDGNALDQIDKELISRNPLAVGLLTHPGLDPLTLTRLWLRTSRSGADVDVDIDALLIATITSLEAVGPSAVAYLLLLPGQRTTLDQNVRTGRVSSRTTRAWLNELGEVLSSDRSVLEALNVLLVERPTIPGYDDAQWDELRALLGRLLHKHISADGRAGLAIRRTRFAPSTEEPCDTGSTDDALYELFKRCTSTSEGADLVNLIMNSLEPSVMADLRRPEEHLVFVIRMLDLAPPVRETVVALLQGWSGTLEELLVAGRAFNPTL